MVECGWRADGMERCSAFRDARISYSLDEQQGSDCQRCAGDPRDRLSGCTFLRGDSRGSGCATGDPALVLLLNRALTLILLLCCALTLILLLNPASPAAGPAVCLQIRSVCHRF